MTTTTIREETDGTGTVTAFVRLRYTLIIAVGYLVLFLAAIGERLGQIALGTVVIGGAYLFVTASQGGIEALLTSEFLVRVPFLLAAGSFLGHLVNRVRGEASRAREEAAVAEGLRRAKASLARLNQRLISEIEERSRVEKELRTLWAAVEHSSTAVLITDRGGVIEYANPSFREMSGLEAGDERALLDLVQDESRRDARGGLRGALGRGLRWKGACRLERRGAASVPVLLSVAPIEAEEDTAGEIVIVLEDLTEQHRAEQALRRANAKLRELAEMRSNLVSIVSHELRTPIAAAKNALDLLDHPSAGGPAGKEGSSRSRASVIGRIDPGDRKCEILSGIEARPWLEVRSPGSDGSRQRSCSCPSPPPPTAFACR